MSDECIHGLAGCQLCKRPPEGMPARVWITARGSHFHLFKDCETLADGQDQAAELGFNTYEIRQVAWGEVESARAICRNCKARDRQA